ncbi:MAG: hypothetical protein CMI13_04290 [Oleibacter sp.]|nr:hypothetical protein [Thalassolituus sp.]|tara:strand:+ start:165 stop:596 length:432 start_codon:yes stop_codon:yes gene_type:complete
MAGTHEENHELFGDDELSESLLEHLPDISDDARRKWPRDLVALIDMYGGTLKRMGYKPAEAERISHALLLDLSTYCGGRYIYLPKNDALKKSIRDVELYRDWSHSGMLPDQLAQKYDLALPYVYRVLKEQREYHLKRVQPQLF